MQDEKEGKRRKGKGKMMKEGRREERGGTG